MDCLSVFAPFLQTRSAEQDGTKELKPVERGKKTQR